MPRKTADRTTQLWVALIGAAAVVIAAWMGLRGSQPNGHPEPSLVTLSGRVVDAQTAAPISRAQVSLETTGAPLISYTDDHGVYEFRVKPIPPSNSIRVRVSAEEYREFNRLLPLTADNTFQEIQLRRMRPLTLSDTLMRPTPPDTQISLESFPDSVAIGESSQIRASAREVPGGLLRNPNFTWSSSAPATASISQNGRVRGVREGASAISVTVGSQTISRGLRVYRPPRRIKFTTHQQGDVQAEEHTLVSSGDSIWLEYLPNGTFHRFRVKGRDVAFNSEGVVAYKVVEPEREIFIPDRGQPLQHILTRREGEDWGSLGRLDRNSE